MNGLEQLGDSLMGRIKILYRDCNVGARGAIMLFAGIIIALLSCALYGVGETTSIVIIYITLAGGFLLFFSYPIIFLGILLLPKASAVSKTEEQGTVTEMLKWVEQKMLSMTATLRKGLEKLMAAYAILLIIEALYREVLFYSSDPLGFIRPFVWVILPLMVAGMLFNLTGRWGWMALASLFIGYYLVIGVLGGRDAAFKKIDDTRKDWTAESKLQEEKNQAAKAKAEAELAKANAEKSKAAPAPEPAQTIAATPTNPNPMMRNLPCGKGIWSDIYAEKVTPRMETTGIVLKVQPNCISQVILLPPEGIHYVWAEGSIDGTGLCGYYSMEQVIQSEEHSTPGNPCGSTQDSGADIVTIADRGTGTDTHVEEPPKGPHVMAIRVHNPNTTGIDERIVFNNQHPPPLYTQ